MMAGYVPSSAEDRAAMLAAVGVSSLEGLYAAVPKEVYHEKLGLPAGLSELEVLKKMEGLAEKNRVFKFCFRGAGAYRHYIPQIVKEITAKEAFRTTYTPYQAEISQGILQSIFEYQTMICELTGMAVSNASVYDGATAAAEAVFMAQERKKSRAVLSGAANPEILEVIQTYCASRSVPVTVIPAKDGVTDADALAAALTDDTACVYFQQPNYFGNLEDAEKLIALAHEKKALAVMGVNPITLGLLQTPGELGADIAVGEGQPLGLPLSFGGPYLGFMAATQKLMRKLPGRIVGQTQDADENRCFVLTLQAREQHIRREKASSNICSNEALCAMTAGAYLTAMGPAGLADAASLCYQKAHYLAGEIAKIGFPLAYGQKFFHEFVTECPKDAKEIEKDLAAQDILSGLPLEGNRMLWCATEMNSKEDIDALITALKGGE